MDLKVAEDDRRRASLESRCDDGRTGDISGDSFGRGSEARPSPPRVGRSHLESDMDTLQAKLKQTCMIEDLKR